MKNLLFLLVCALPTVASAQMDQSTMQLSREIFKQLVEINTTDSVGNVSAASEAMANRFRAAGFTESDIYVGGPNERKKNLVVRLHGSGKQRPILLIGHLDVVEANREGWTTDPFQLVEKDGYFYGRGTQDMKDEDAIMVTTLIRMRNEGVVPERDVILALTADEEGGKYNGVDWLLKNRRELIDAELVINTDDICLWTENGKPLIMEVNASEKTYADYQLSVSHYNDAATEPQNPIYQLSHALLRLRDHEFPVELSEVTRAYYQRMAKVEGGQRAADMQAILANPRNAEAARRLSQDANDNAMLHTTCVATRANTSNADDAPPSAEAIVNCRILPGHTRQEIREVLQQVVSDRVVSVRYVDEAGQVSDVVAPKATFVVHPLRHDVLYAVDSVSQEMWPSIPVVPTMARGASDGVLTSAAGMPTYIVAGVAIDRNDDREHGVDERVPVKSFYQGLEFWYRFLKLLLSTRSTSVTGSAK